MFAIRFHGQGYCGLVLTGSDDCIHSYRCKIDDALTVNSHAEGFDVIMEYRERFPELKTQGAMVVRIHHCACGKLSETVFCSTECAYTAAIA